MLAIIALMGVCVTVGYAIGVCDTNAKWQVEQAKNWRPLKG